MQEKSNGSSCVSKQLIEFILSRAQPFPVECLKICLVCPVPISGPSHALCRDVASDVRGSLLASGATFTTYSITTTTLSSTYILQEVITRIAGRV